MIFKIMVGKIIFLNNKEVDANMKVIPINPSMRLIPGQIVVKKNATF